MVNKHYFVLVIIYVYIIIIFIIFHDPCTELSKDSTRFFFNIIVIWGFVSKNHNYSRYHVYDTFNSNILKFSL